MGDFKSDFWSNYITVIAVGGVIFCFIILVSQLMAKTNKGNEKEVQPHTWDGNLQEYNNPMPLWWVVMFFGTFIFAAGYFYLYPGLGSYKGAASRFIVDYTDGWTSKGQYEIEKTKLDEQSKGMYQKAAATPIAELAKDPEIMQTGQRLFQANCSQCHGSGAQGSPGFPNLADSDWLYGGWPEAIERSILGGRLGVMPAQTELAKDPNALNDVANYVLSLSGSSHNATAAGRGKDKFAVCSACHTTEGTGALSDKTGGQFAVGAPNLTDKIWLHGGDAKTIMQTISNGRNNVMPSWECNLGAERAHILAAYVWGLNKNLETNALLNPTAPPDYLVAAEQKAQDKWKQDRASASADVSACLTTSVHHQAAELAKVDAQKAQSDAATAAGAKSADTKSADTAAKK